MLLTFGGDHVTRKKNFFCVHPPTRITTTRTRIVMGMVGCMSYLVHFKHCPSNSCSSCDMGGDYVIDLVSDYAPCALRMMLSTKLI